MREGQREGWKKGGEGEPSTVVYGTVAGFTPQYTNVRVRDILLFVYQMED